MQTLTDFLASAPKPHLAKLFRRDNPDAGLVAGGMVAEAVRAHALDPKRIAAVLDALEPSGRRLLMGIYASEERGMLETELARACEEGAPAAAHYLALLEYELLVARREGEHRSYHGFREAVSLVLPRLLEEFAPAEEAPPQAAWISNASHVVSHFCHFLARVGRGDLKLTQNGELHRKSLMELARGFGSGAMLSPVTAEEEAGFLFRFAIDSDLLLEEEGLLRLSPSAAEWLEDGGEEVVRRLRGWWQRKRVRGLSRLLGILAADSGAARGVMNLAPLFSVYEGWDKMRARPRSELQTWENLPRLLRELWILGGIEFAMQRGRVRWARVPLDGDAALDSAAATESARGLPNFEALVPAGVPLGRLFQIELLAVRENDERMTRYRFTKDSVVAGLRAGVAVVSLEELAAWLGFEEPARRVLAEWAATYASAVFREVFVLRVRDAVRFSELEAFPRFMDLVVEVIPGYGFVMSRGAREAARELLQAFDLQPGDEAASPGSRRPVSAPEGDPSWSLPVFSHGETAYRHAAPARKPAVSALAKEEREKAETPVHRLRSLEGAIAAQRSVEFVYASGTARIRVQPLHVLRNREPMKLIAVDLASGHRNEYVIDQVAALKVVGD